MNPNNEAMRADFEAATIEYARPLAEADLRRLVGGIYASSLTQICFAIWQAAHAVPAIPQADEKKITITLSCNHDGDPLLVLSNGQSILFKDIIGPPEITKEYFDDKRDAQRWRAFRERDALPSLEATDFLEMFREDADGIIDAQIAEKTNSHESR